MKRSSIWDTFPAQSRHVRRASDLPSGLAAAGLRPFERRKRIRTYRVSRTLFISPHRSMPEEHGLSEASSYRWPLPVQLTFERLTDGIRSLDLLLWGNRYGTAASKEPLVTPQKGQAHDRSALMQCDGSMCSFQRVSSCVCGAGRPSGILQH